MRVALFLFAGPEMLCKALHTFVFSRDIFARGGTARIVLAGKSPEWLPKLRNPEHKLHVMSQNARGEGLIKAVCKACAMQAGVVQAAEQKGLSLVGGTFGHVSLASYVECGFQVINL
jgi:hypothetical protein